jgi:hypothetical protein
MVASVDPLVGKDCEPGTYFVTGVEISGALWVGLYRAPDGTPRALALGRSEYHRVRVLLQQGTEATVHTAARADPRQQPSASPPPITPKPVKS